MTAAVLVAVTLCAAPHVPAPFTGFQAASATLGSPKEVVREVRVHGNAYLTDAEVLAVAGVAVGDPATPETLAAVERRLRESGRFETVQIRKRYRSLADPSDVALVLVVHEKPGIVSATTSTAPVYTPWRRARRLLMFLPIVDYGDGYGFTYGARFSTIDLLGAGERVSFPLTWGGTRRAAVEVERTFRRGPLTRVQSSFGIWRRENPRFEIADRRVEFRATAEREFGGLLRAGVDTARSAVRFGTLDDTLWTLGTTLALDTRTNPAFPRNAIYAGAGWTGLHVDGRPRINRYLLDARGYAGLVGQVVAAGRVQYTHADATLPPYERLLLGGSPTLRGYSAGAFDGDRLLVVSAELRAPVTSVLSAGRFGVSAFVDAGKVADAGARLADERWRRGVGGGVFLIFSILRINLDVARGLDDGRTRLHLSTGFAF